MVYRRSDEDSTRIDPRTAAALLALRADGTLHPLLLACWSEVLAAANEVVPPPEVRALVSEDNEVWVVAPVWEGDNVRGLVCVGDFIHGPVLLRDLDRKLLTYTLEVPKRPAAAAGWIEAGHLLIPAT